MTASAVLEPCPVDEEIRPSWVPIVFGFLLSVAGFAVFALALLAPDAWLLPTDHPLGRRLVGLLGVAVTAYTAYAAVRPWLEGRRLVLGAECLRLIEAGRVVGQVPYDNIARLSVDRVGRALAVLVVLHDAQRPDTWWEAPPGFHGYLKRARGCDLYLVWFSVPPETLREKLLARCSSARQAPVL